MCIVFFGELEMMIQNEFSALRVTICDNLSDKDGGGQHRLHNFDPITLNRHTQCAEALRATQSAEKIVVGQQHIHKKGDPIAVHM
jgi:hypothetical protein